MSKNIILTVTAEGYTEEKFVNELLLPHLATFNITVLVRKILTNRKRKIRGGYVSYAKLRNDINQWIKEMPNAYHTTMIDLYGLDSEFPGYARSLSQPAYSKVEIVEKEFFDNIASRQFIPYIQLHEYEAILFSDTAIMEKWLGLYDSFQSNSFTAIREGYATPEEINDSSKTAPSKRIEHICPSYDKVDDGILLAKEIGLATIRKECPHFNSWLTNLENLK